METKKTRFSINEGPSVESLFAAFRYAYSDIDVPLTFDVSVKPFKVDDTIVYDFHLTDFTITGISYEDGTVTGDNLIVRGFCLFSKDKGRQAFEAFYNVKSRSGFLELFW